MRKHYREGLVLSTVVSVTGMYWESVGYPPHSWQSNVHLDSCIKIGMFRLPLTCRDDNLTSACLAWAWGKDGGKEGGLVCEWRVVGKIHMLSSTFICCTDMKVGFLFVTLTFICKVWVLFFPIWDFCLIFFIHGTYIPKNAQIVRVQVSWFLQTETKEHETQNSPPD